MVLWTVLGGCTKPQPLSDDPQLRQSLSLLMPAAVRIVEPFTAWSNHDDTPGIDAITVCVQPVNTAGDPMQTAGRMFVELYTFRPASGDPKGERLELWDVPILSQPDQEARWNRGTQWYEFHLGLSAKTLASLSAERKFVLVVTHNSPLGEHLTDEYVVEVPLARGRMAPPG
ncbi:MAG: hypothetical protein IID39_04365 [Planctomycetes bacterium]|nr:hypothetical protein [Planctomycetota bacterium]